MGFEASRVVIVDVDRPLPPLRAEDAAGRWHGRARLLVRWHGRPVGVTDVDLGGGLGPVAVGAAVWQALGPELAERIEATTGARPTTLPPNGLPAPEAGPELPTASATVAIATRDRPTALARCLHAVLALDHPAFDVVVVDNAPSDDRAHAVVDALRTQRVAVRYVREDQPGLARAHNAALPHLTGEVVAFTDDDVEVDPLWLRRLTDGFVDDRVACVTGMIFPAEVETPAQAWIEAHAGFGKGFERQVFDLDEHRPDDRLFPFTAGRLGSGANMAFRTEVLRELGGFDETLGVGTPARGGDDLAAFYDVIRAGHRLVYEPAALVLHHHHVDTAAVRRLAYSYGVALSAYLTRAVVTEPRALVAMAARLPGGVRHGLKTTQAPDLVVPGLAGAGWRQRLGMVVGPWSYARSRRAGSRA
ncbi:MAG TPA: glycosyltransferase [Acidimicrobiales bacterium]|nr:glycosyltransferase [Acidimicrobiales bacterium]